MSEASLIAKITEVEGKFLEFNKKYASSIDYVTLEINQRVDALKENIDSLELENHSKTLQAIDKLKDRIGGLSDKINELKSENIPSEKEKFVVFFRRELGVLKRSVDELELSSLSVQIPSQKGLEDAEKVYRILRTEINVQINEVRRCLSSLKKTSSKSGWSSSHYEKQLKEIQKLLKEERALRIKEDEQLISHLNDNSMVLLEGFQKFKAVN